MCRNIVHAEMVKYSHGYGGEQTMTDLTKMTVAVLTAAVAAAGAQAETLWPGPDTVMRAQSDSSIATLADGSIGVTTGAKANWPGVRMDFVKGEADLSRFGRFTVTVSNTTHETRTVHLSVKGRGVQGQGPGGSVVLKPHETGDIVATATVERSDSQTVDCVFEEPPEPGTYTLVVACRNGMRESLKPATAKVKNVVVVGG